VKDGTEDYEANHALDIRQATYTYDGGKHIIQKYVSERPFAWAQEWKLSRNVWYIELVSWSWYHGASIIELALSS
jgi:hypothetical protein